MIGSRKSTIDELLRKRIPHFHEYYDRLTYEAAPFVGYRLSRNQRLPHVTINHQGYRGQAFGGREEIVLLGDSVTFGVGVSSDDERFPRFLETAAGVAVADASMRAYRVCQQYVQLPALLALLAHARVVVVWCGYADLLFWATTGGRVEGIFDFSEKYGNALSRLTRRVTRIARATPKRLRRIAHEELKPGRDGLEALLRHVLLYLRAVRDVCAGRGIESVVLIQPFVRSEPGDPELRRLLHVYDESTRAKCGVSWYVAAPIFVSRLVEGIGEIQGVQGVDCQQFVLESDFLDQVHLRQPAHERLAKEVAARLPTGPRTAA